jgi:hypothetical protein
MSMVTQVKQQQVAAEGSRKQLSLIGEVAVLAAEVAAAWKRRKEGTRQVM